jgi:hypothetical protein
LAEETLRQVFSPRDTKLFPLRVEALRVERGDTVEPGTVLLTLKTAQGKTLAMRSPLAGTVTQIAAGVGDSLASPRALVIVAEADTRVVDGEWEEADDQPSPSPGDAAGGTRERTGPDAASDFPRRRTGRKTRGALIGVAAGLAALALAYPFYGEDLLQALRTAAPSARTAASTAPSASSGTATATTRAPKPAPPSGPLTKAAMTARDLGDQRQGLTDAPRFVGLGVLRIERKNRKPLDCEAVAISGRFAAISTLCYEPTVSEYGEQDDMRMSFYAFRPIVTRRKNGTSDEIPGIRRLRRLDVKAVHVWPGRVGDDGVASIALAEFASTAPDSIGSAGFWRFTKNSAPPLLAFRGVALDDPGRYHRVALNCRYWLAETAEAPGDRPLPLATDPDCAPGAGPRRGAIRARHENGKMYFAGFFTSQRRNGKTVRHAVAFSPADTQLLRLAKGGDPLPANRMTVRPGKRLDASGKGLGLRFSNPCERTIAFHILGSNTMSARQRLLTYKVPAGRATPVERHLEPAYFQIGIGQTDRGPIPGSRRETFDDKRLDLVPFKNKSGMELQVTAICD